MSIKPADRASSLRGGQDKIIVRPDVHDGRRAEWEAARERAINDQNQAQQTLELARCWRRNRLICFNL